MFPLSLDEMVSEDNAVRIIDLFVNRFDFIKLGFAHAITADEGRPPFAPSDLMKLYLYGYMNRIRSSRKLEKELSRVKGLHAVGSLPAKVHCHAHRLEIRAALIRLHG